MKEPVMNSENEETNLQDLKPPVEESGDNFLVVGLGASAGGIKAFKEFFTRVPADSGIAYVVILHLSPEHESKLAEILQLSSEIPVTQVRGTVRIKPNQVYVIPPNQSLSMRDGHLALSEMTRIEERRAPVDIFFRTLADAIDTRAVCVILSGTGANGSMGLKRVKEYGGVVLAQDPKEAEYGDMPRNAIATGLVDYILPVSQIPAKIIGYKENLSSVRIPAEPLERRETDEQALRDIFTQLRVRTGHDFTNYKRATVIRRIERRINVFELPDLPSYARLMRERPEEARALLKDLLISVTNFFRDGESFQALESKVIPKLFEGKQSEDNVRVWVAGCATGEEAYSVAMLLSEYTANSVNAPIVQVFATDIDEQAVAAAREGYYTEADVADVSPERLRRFFIKETEGYRVRRELRETVLFAAHNIIRDPPFSHLDLVTCRNLLIYLNRTAQDKVMEVLHFALRPGSYLFLGTSESINGASDLFMTVDKDHHIFQSRAVAARLNLPIPDLSITARLDQRARDERVQEVRAQERLSYLELQLRMLEQYGPPSVLINENYDIVHLSERAGQYLQLSGGEPSYDLLRIVRPELRLELRTALYQAVNKLANIEARGLSVKLDDHTQIVNLIVRPVMREDDPGRGFILVIFEELNEKDNSQLISNEETISAVEPMARQIEEELMRVKAQLRATIEQYEVQHEELKASNEELQAMNEELRSAAEELETSKEELQSVNEELTTVNQELKIKIEELSQANNDFQNLMASTEIGTIFLDRGLRVKLFTPRARDIFNLIPADINRPLMDITNNLIYQDLHNDVDQVLDKLQTVEREVQTYHDRWYLVRLLPYRTTDDRIDGVVITFMNITHRKIYEEKLRLSRDESEVRVRERTSELEESNQALRTEVEERGAAEERARGLLRQIVTAQEDERRRIARDLHDQLGQQLTALRLNLETVRAQSEHHDELSAQVERAQIIAKQLDAEVDFLSWELRPAALDDLGLEATLANFVQEWSRHYGIAGQFHTAGSEIGRLSPEIETTLYRIAQEALNNISKHAQASQVAIILERRNDHAVLIIEDNGKGYDLKSIPPGSRKRMGLVGMRERAALIGGTLEIESEPGKGTTVFARTPLIHAEEGSIEE
jgi:two-component system, chemotaxis family, CheB/CheR fusion protein